MYESILLRKKRESFSKKHKKISFFQKKKKSKTAPTLFHQTTLKAVF